MIFKNTRENFGLVAKFFHWAVAVLVLALLSVGFFMAGLEMGPPKFTVYMLHKSFGILVLALVVGRVLWLKASAPPDPPSTHKKWEKTLAKIVHFGLYACLFLMPVSGWVMSSAGGFPVSFFGLFTLPPLTGKSEDVFEISKEIHEIAAFGILGLLALHFAGAFKHHFIDRDATLQRMTSPKAGLRLGMVLAAAAGLLWLMPFGFVLLGDDDDGQEGATAGAHADEEHDDDDHGEETHGLNGSGGWRIDSENSSIKFEATQQAAPFQGEFRDFGGRIVFDPARLEEAYVDIWIDIGSIDTGSPERDAQARSPEWFDAKNFPKALFVADSFSRTGTNEYVAHGALTLRGKAEMIDLPFSLDIRESPRGQEALMQSRITLGRLGFGIGQGQWQGTDAIGDDVKVSIAILAAQ